MTIFGPAWADLELEHVAAYLNGEQADDEPLLWEAKGSKPDAKETEPNPNEVRRQVCAFANGHEGGYLILGANKPKGATAWTFDGVEFRGGEPITWISTVVADLNRGVRPRPDFDVTAWPAEEGHVAVVRINPISTPPCIANGTVYERLPGRSRVVRDPQRLADLFARGDQARRGAEALADRAATRLLDDWLDGDAGAMYHERVDSAVRQAESDHNEDDEPDEEAEIEADSQYLRFAVGVAATGNPPNISGRLFRPDLVVQVWNRLRERPTGLPPGYETGPDPTATSQDALTWRHETRGLVNAVSIVRAAWDGSAAAGQRILMDDIDPERLVERRLAHEWRLADELVQRLGGFGEVYVVVRIAGGRFPRRRKQRIRVEMRRGPLLPGVADEHLESVARELNRAVGYFIAEP